MKWFTMNKSKSVEQKLAVAKTKQQLAAEQGTPVRTPSGAVFTGFTDPEERKILEKGGGMGDIEAHRISKADAAAPELLKEIQSGGQPEMSSYQKDAVLRLVASGSAKPGSAPAAPAPVAAGKPAAAPATKPAAIKPATAPVAAAPRGPKLTTAADFATPELRMAQSEFDKLNHTDKNRFFREGGKLEKDPENVFAALKQRAEAAGVVKKPDFSHLKGAERTAAAMGFTSKRDAFFRAEASRQIHDEDMSASTEAKSAGAYSTTHAQAAASISRDTRVTARAKELAAKFPL